MKDRVIENAADLGLNLGFAMAGFFGSLFHVRGRSLWGVFIVILAGTSSANYLTPLVIRLLSIPDGGQYACAFLIGTMGLRSTEFVLGKLQRRVDAA